MSNYINSFNSFSKKAAKKLEEQAQDTPMSVPAEFQADQQRINDLKNTITAAKQDLVQKEADLNRMTQELQNKINAKNQQVAQTTPPASTT